MKRIVHIAPLFLILGGVLWAGCTNQQEVASLPYYRTADLTPEWLTDAEASAPSMHRVADWFFTNQKGDMIGSADLEGKIYIANFFFAQCTKICPTMSTNLASVQEAFRYDDRVALISHSVTPEVDTAAALEAYGKANGVQPGKWHLVTGTREAIYTQARTSYSVDVQDEMDVLLHTEVFVLIDQQRRIRGVYNGTLALEVAQLMEDITVLQQEA